MSTKLQHPFTCIIAGPSSSGKTVFVKKLLEQKNDVILDTPERILWCYGEFQPLFQKLSDSVPGIQFVEGLPDDWSDHLDPRHKSLIVIDDLMSECGNDSRITKLFTKGSHHRNLSVVYIVQNLFYQSKESRTISLNCHYIVLFKNPRHRSQITHLAKQMYPNQTRFMSEAYFDTTEEPYGYLFVDLKPNTPEKYRLRTNIFKGETPYAYIPEV